MTGRFIVYTASAGLVSGMGDCPVETGDPDPEERGFGPVMGIDTQEGLERARGNTGVYARLLRMFRAAHGDDFEKLKALLARDDWEEARHLVHSLKGTAGNIGARTLFRACVRVEKALAGRVCKTGLGELGRALGQVLGGIAQWQERPSVSPAVAVHSRLAWDEWTAMMGPLLRQGNIRAVAVMDRVPSDIRGRVPDLLAGMEACVAQCRFGEALEMLETIGEKIRFIA